MLPLRNYFLILAGRETVFKFLFLDPTNYSFTNDLFPVLGDTGEADGDSGGTSNIGDTITFNSYNYTDITVDETEVDDSGVALTNPLTVNGNTYSSGDNVEADMASIVVDQNTGLHYRITTLNIDNEFAGLVVSQAWDTTTGAYVGPPPSTGVVLTAIDGDDLDGTPNITEFAYDPSYVGTQGDDTFLNANSGIPLCFSADTMIKTVQGSIRVVDLRIGDKVLTDSGAFEPVLWCKSRVFTADVLAKHPNFQPVRLKAGSLSKGIPSRDLVLSPQHRVLVRSKIANRMFGEPEVLVSARSLVGLPGISIARNMSSVTYVHFICKGHQLVIAEGALAETLYLGEEVQKALTPADVAEISFLMGDDLDPVRPLIKNSRARSLAERHKKNVIPLVF